MWYTHIDEGFCHVSIDPDDPDNPNNPDNPDNPDNPLGGVDPYATAISTNQKTITPPTQATQATRTAGLAKGSALAAQPKGHAHATPDLSVEMFAIKKPLMHPIGTVWFCDGCGMQNAMGQLKCPQCQGNRTAFLPINY